MFDSCVISRLQLLELLDDVLSFSGEVKPPPATLPMVAGGGGLVFHVLMLSMPCVNRFRSLLNH